MVYELEYEPKTGSGIVFKILPAVPHFILLNISSLPPGSRASFTRGAKQYELSNHLGNVLITVSDKKTGIRSVTDTTVIDHYEADVITATDYYPFGMLMPGRSRYPSEIAETKEIQSCTSCGMLQELINNYFSTLYQSVGSETAMISYIQGRLAADSLSYTTAEIQTALNTCDTASPDDVATSPISSGIQNGLFNVASAFGLNAIDDLAGDLTDAIKGNQTWSQAGRGMLNTLSDVKNNIIRSPVQGLSNGGRGLAPVVAADGQTLVVTQKAAAVPVLSNPTAVVVLMNATKTTNAANKVDDAVGTKKAIVKNKVTV